jgi:hypothetical protein
LLFSSAKVFKGALFTTLAIRKGKLSLHWDFIMALPHFSVVGMKVINYFIFLGKGMCHNSWWFHGLPLAAL